MKKKQNKQNETIPRLLEEELIKFIDDFSNGLIFTSNQVKDTSSLSMVFMPLMMYKFSESQINDIGIIYAYLHTAGPRYINGYPIFMSASFLHKEDWAIAVKFLQEHEAQKKLAILQHVKKEI